MGMPDALRQASRAPAQAFQQSLARAVADPAARGVVCLILGVLYESYIIRSHSLHASIRGRRDCDSDGVRA